MSFIHFKTGIECLHRRDLSRAVSEKLGAKFLSMTDEELLKEAHRIDDHDYGKWKEFMTEGFTDWDLETLKETESPLDALEFLVRGFQEFKDA